MDETSYYHRQAAAPGRPPLTGPVETEIAIVGGGLAGLAVALSLAERGTAPVLIEAATLASGASGRNGGMVSAGFTAPLPALERRLGVPVAERLMRASLDAISLIRARIARHAIACAPVDGLVIASWFDEAAELHAEAQDLNERFGMRLEFWPRERLRALYPSPRYWDGLFDPEALHLDPLALARGYALAAERLGAVIHEHSPGLELERLEDGRWAVRTPEGVLRARRLVLCQSAYPPALLPRLARATLPVFTYVMVTEPLTGAHAGVIRAPYAVYDTRFATGYYRPLPDGRLLWGGRISTRERQRDLHQLMRRDLARVYPQLADVAVAQAWSGRMGFTRHKMPVVRELEPGLWVSTGFGGHGLNTTTMAGELVAAALTEGGEDWRLLAGFAPRWVGGSAGRYAAQAIYWRHALQDSLRAAWQARANRG